MKKNVERTLFWFKDGSELLLTLNNRFFAMGTMLNNFINETYFGKKIKFINIYFSTEKTYKLFPKLIKNSIHYVGGYLSYNGVIDLEMFNNLSKTKQDEYIWEKSYEYLQECSRTIKNNDLQKASKYAYEKGLESNLNPNFKVVDTVLSIYGTFIKSSIWIIFKEDGMYSKLTLEKNGEIIFEKDIDKTEHGVEFFLEMYKNIECEDNKIIIKGHRSVRYLPLSIYIDEKLIKE